MKGLKKHAFEEKYQFDYQRIVKNNKIFPDFLLP
jgi:hypothetical protein